MNWINSMLSDGINGSVSSKRVITLCAFILCAWGFVADVLGHDVNPKLFDSMMYIVVAGLGFTASEKFSKQKSETE